MIITLQKLPTLLMATFKPAEREIINSGKNYSIIKSSLRNSTDRPILLLEVPIDQNYPFEAKINYFWLNILVLVAPSINSAPSWQDTKNTHFLCVRWWITYGSLSSLRLRLDKSCNENLYPVVASISKQFSYCGDKFHCLESILWTIHVGKLAI